MSSSSSSWTRMRPSSSSPRSSRRRIASLSSLILILTAVGIVPFSAQGTVIVLPPSSSSSPAASTTPVPHPTSYSSSFTEKKNVYPSRAAGFGMEFIKGVRYVAELREPTDGDIYLCGDGSDHDNHTNNNNSSSIAEDYGEERLLTSALSSSLQLHYRTPSFFATTTGGGGVIPVALLAKRGKCSYETKARVASTYYASSAATTATTTARGSEEVHFVIVYNDVDTVHANTNNDDDEEDDDDLITMMPDDDDRDATSFSSSSSFYNRGKRRAFPNRDHNNYKYVHNNESYKDLGLVFVSHRSGMELHDRIIRAQSSSSPSATTTTWDEGGGGGEGGGGSVAGGSRSRSSSSSTGPRIFIDGDIDSTRSLLSPEDEATVMGMALTIFLVGCLCSSSLFLNAARTNAMGSDSSYNGGRVYYLNANGRRQPSPPRWDWGEGITRGGLGSNNNDTDGMIDGGRRRRRRTNGLRLLTIQEVEALPTQKYQCIPSSPSLLFGVDDEGDCSGKELRDKCRGFSPLGIDADRCNDDDVGNEDISAVCRRGWRRRSSGGESSKLNTPGDTRRGGMDGAINDKDNAHFFDPHHNLCSICLDEYEPGESLRILPCLHAYHSDCIFPWLTERSPTCPLCKAMFEAVHYCVDGESGNDENDDSNGDEEGGEGTRFVRDRQRRRRRRGVRSSEEQPATGQRGENVADHTPPGNDSTNSSTTNEGRIGVENIMASDDNRAVNDGRALLGGRWRRIFDRTISLRRPTLSHDALEEPLLENGGGDDELV